MQRNFRLLNDSGVLRAVVRLYRFVERASKRNAEDKYLALVREELPDVDDLQMQDVNHLNSFWT